MDISYEPYGMDLKVSLYTSEGDTNRYLMNTYHTRPRLAISPDGRIEFTTEILYPKQLYRASDGGNKFYWDIVSAWVRFEIQGGQQKLVIKTRSRGYKKYFTRQITWVCQYFGISRHDIKWEVFSVPS